MITLSNKAMLEISEISFRAQKLARGSAADRAESTVLTQRISTIRQQGISSDEMRARYAVALDEDIKNEAGYRTAFVRYMRGQSREIEQRDWLAGEQTISWTGGPTGGYLVPIDTWKTVTEAMAQTSPLLNPTICDFWAEPTSTLQPETIYGYDLSTIEGSLVGEAVQQVAGVIPTVAGKMLRSNLIFKISMAGSLEYEEDADDFMNKVARAMGVGLARVMGVYATTGTGSATQPQGIYSALTSSYSTGSGKITLTDIESIFFSINRIYRAQPKCGWLMPDSVYQRVRQAVDGSNRPLLNVVDDKEVLMGKPVYIANELPAVGGSPASNGAIIFGDLSHFKIRTSRATLQRTTQTNGSDITKGESLYIGRIRMDSQPFDPSSGSAQPYVLATVTD